MLCAELCEENAAVVSTPMQTFIVLYETVFIRQPLPVKMAPIEVT